jgi:hypothetical protein
MSTRYNNGSHYENHQRAAELNYQAAHAHRSAAEGHNKQDQLTGHEQSKQAQEYSHQAYVQPKDSHPGGTHEPDCTAFGPGKIVTSGVRTLADQRLSGGLARRRLVPPLRAITIPQ